MYIDLLLLITSLLPAQASMIPSPLGTSVPSFTSLVSAAELNVPSNDSATISGSKWKPFCTATERWNQPAREKSDCQGVVQLFYYETMSDGGRKSNEFMSPGSQRRKHMRVQKTPRKYTFRTCTLAIVMLHDFPEPSTLPGGAKFGPTTDHSTYLGLNRVAEQLVENCAVAKGESGWVPTGQYDGIGVFVWSTDSEQDKEIEDDKVESVAPSAEAVGGGSAATS